MLAEEFAPDLVCSRVPRCPGSPRGGKVFSSPRQGSLVAITASGSRRPVPLPLNLTRRSPDTTPLKCAARKLVQRPRPQLWSLSPFEVGSAGRR